MNALTQIVADPIETAVESANAWVRTATPLIKAYLALDEIDSELGIAAASARGNKPWNEPVEYDERVCRDAQSDVKKPIKELYASIEGIRDDFISDASPRQPVGNPTQAQWEAYDAESKAYDERLPREVISVDAAISKIAEVA